MSNRAGIPVRPDETRRKTDWQVAAYLLPALIILLVSSSILSSSAYPSAFTTRRGN